MDQIFTTNWLPMEKFVFEDILSVLKAHTPFAMGLYDDSRKMGIIYARFIEKEILARDIV